MGSGVVKLLRQLKEARLNSGRGKEEGKEDKTTQTANTTPHVK
jgi:hypothetical protein